MVVVPSAVGLAVLAQPAVAVLVRGAFDSADAVITADVLQALAAALIGFSVYLFTLRGFYALQDTRTPFLVNVFENGANIVELEVWTEDPDDQKTTPGTAIVELPSKN